MSDKLQKALDKITVVLFVFGASICRFFRKPHWKRDAKKEAEK